MAVIWRVRRAILVALIGSIAALGSGSSLAGEGETADGEMLARGKAVFTEESVPRCGICHRLADAGAAGTIAPDLDEIKPTRDQVRRAVLDGPAVMPSYGESLSREQIDAVSHYVAEVAGSAD